MGGGNATGGYEPWALMGKSFDIPLAWHQGPTSPHINSCSSHSTMWLDQNSPLNRLHWPPLLPITLVLLFDPKLHLTANNFWDFTFNQMYRLTLAVCLLSFGTTTLPCYAAALHCWNVPPWLRTCELLFYCWDNAFSSLSVYCHRCLSGYLSILVQLFSTVLGLLRKFLWEKNVTVKVLSVHAV